MQEHLDPATAKALLDKLPEYIRQAYLDHATEIKYPVEAVLEMALAGFLDSEALSFVDCKPDFYEVRKAS